MNRNNKRGQALITVLAFMSFILFLGMVLLSRSTGSVRQTNEINRYAQQESVDRIVPHAAYLIVSDGLTERIAAASAASRQGVEEKWNISQFDNALRAQLIDWLGANLEGDLSDFFTQELSAGYTFSSTSTDLDADTKELSLTATNDQSGHVLDMVFHLHLPSITDPEGLGEGNGSYLSGQDPAVEIHSITY